MPTLQQKRAVAFGAQALAPNAIAELDLWLDARFISGLAGGAAVSPWVDRSAAGNDASQGTAAQRPTFSLTGVNGRPGVVFDGTDDNLATPSFQWYPSKRGTFLVVFKPSHTGATGSDVLATYPAGGTARRWVKQANQQGHRLYDGSSTQTLNADATTVPKCVIWRRSADTAWQFSLNGAAFDSVTVADTQPDELAAYIGTNSLGTEPAAMTVGAILHYSRSLSTGELNALLHRYVRPAWGVSVSTL